MPKTILYIAQSLDGYIARPDGSLDWLTSFPPPKTGDYGYESLLEQTELIVMGRKTYEELLGFGIDWPFTDFKTLVVSSNSSFKISTENTALVSDNIEKQLSDWKTNATKNAWIVGGAHLIKSLLDKQLIDEIIISILPKTIGNGIKLFSEGCIETDFELIDCTTYETGLVNLHYKKSN